MRQLRGRLQVRRKPRALGGLDDEIVWHDAERHGTTCPGVARPVQVAEAAGPQTVEYRVVTERLGHVRELYWARPRDPSRHRPSDQSQFSSAFSGAGDFA